MTRVFLITRQKTGTYQALGLIHPVDFRVEHFVDRSGADMRGMESYGYNWTEPGFRTNETIEALRSFREKAFGHIAYLPEYVEALKTKPTRVLFNMRDPRDVVISRWHRILKFIADGDPDGAWLNYRRASDGRRFTDLEDPFSEMIISEAIQWTNWLDWVDEPFTTVVRYEDLRLNPWDVVPKLAKKLADCNLLHPSGMIKHLLPKPSNPTFRKGAVGEWRTHFEPHHIELADEYFGPILERFGYGGPEYEALLSRQARG